MAQSGWDDWESAAEQPQVNVPNFVNLNESEFPPLRRAGDDDDKDKPYLGPIPQMNQSKIQVSSQVRILKRADNQANAGGQGATAPSQSASSKSATDREREYQEARARIFGSDTKSPSLSTSPAPSPARSPGPPSAPVGGPDTRQQQEVQKKSRKDPAKGSPGTKVLRQPKQPDNTIGFR